MIGDPKCKKVDLQKFVESYYEQQCRLEPCPFCGGKAIYYKKPIPMIQCKLCLAEIRGAKFRIPPVHYDEYLAGLWNRRVR